MDFLSKLDDDLHDILSAYTANSILAKSDDDDELQGKAPPIPDYRSREHALLLSALEFEDMNYRRGSISRAYTEILDLILDGMDDDEAQEHLDLKQQADSFKVWLQQGTGCFYITGKMISGKAPLMQYIENHPRTDIALLEWANKSEVLKLHYSLWRYSSRLQSSTQGLLRTLIFLIICRIPELTGFVIAKMDNEQLSDMEETGGANVVWRRSQLDDILHGLLTNELSAKKNFCIFVSGLDEAGMVSMDMLSALNSTMTKPNVKMCILSTLNPEVHRRLQISGHLRLEAFSPVIIRRDIAIAMSHVSTSDVFNMNSEESKILADTISKRTHGALPPARRLLRAIVREINRQASFEEVLNFINPSLAGIDKSVRRVRPYLGPNFQEILKENGVDLDTVFDTSHKPENLQYLSEMLRSPKAQEALSFDVFAKGLAKVETEADLKSLLENCIREKSIFSHCEVHFDKSFLSMDRYDRIARGRPDFAAGEDPTTLRTQLRLGDNYEHPIWRYIMPSRAARICLPNFFIELWGPFTSHKEHVSEAIYYGAIGARAIHMLRRYLKAEGGFEGEAILDDQLARTITITASTMGILEIYATHVTEGEDSGQGPQLEYFTSLLQRFDMTDEGQYDAWQSALTNSYHWAEQIRKEVIGSPIQAPGDEDSSVSYTAKQSSTFNAESTNPTSLPTEAPSLKDQNQVTADDQRKYTASIASADSDISLTGLDPKGREEFVALLTDQILFSLGTGRARIKYNEDVADRLKTKLPALLRSVAMQLVEEMDSKPSLNSRGLERESIRLVRKYRGHITKSFHESLKNSPRHVEIGVETLVKATSQWQTRVAAWETDAVFGAPDEVNNADSTSIADEEDDTETDLPHPIQEIRNYFVHSAQYQAMVEEIKQELFPMRRNALRTIRLEIEAGFQTVGTALSRTQGQTPYHATFELYSDLRDFLKRNYPKGHLQTLEDLITITGHAVNAEVTSCAEYMSRIWPDTGLKTLTALQAALHSEGLKDSRSISHNTTVAIHFLAQMVSVQVTGSADDVIQVGQQLAWLGAACRHPLTGGVAITTAEISIKASTEDVIPGLFCELTFWDDKAVEFPNGTCWHKMFDGATVAAGFPIEDRNSGEIGLEISLGLMVDLCSANYAVVWNGGYVLKGFSTMLIPTALLNDSVQWHLLHDSSGKRLAYYAGEGISRCPETVVSIGVFESSRAFLGWCSAFDCPIGTATLSCNIDYSGLHNCGPGYGFSSITFTGGKWFTAALSATKGKKDTALHISQETNVLKVVDDLPSRHVALYDVDTKRAWLIDGLRAVLHLIRTHIFEKSRKVNLGDFTLPAQASDKHVIEQFLLDNLSKPVLSGTESDPDGLTPPYCLKDLILSTANTFAFLEDHEKLVQFPGMEIPHSFGPVLLGWEFRAVARGKRRLFLKETKLQDSASSWVELLRDISALVFFGSGFGDIMVPKSTDVSSRPACRNWECLPTGKDLIAIPCEVLDNLYFEEGCKRTRERLTESELQWGQRGHPFQPCQRSACDGVIQELSHRKDLQPPKDMPADGAVIFGFKKPGNTISRLLQAKASDSEMSACDGEYTVAIDQGIPLQAHPVRPNLAATMSNLPSTEGSINSAPEGPGSSGISSQLSTNPSSDTSQSVVAVRKGKGKEPRRDHGKSWWSKGRSLVGRREK